MNDQLGYYCSSKMKAPKRIEIPHLITSFSSCLNYSICTTTSNVAFKWGFDHDHSSSSIFPVKIPLVLDDYNREMDQSKNIKLDLLIRRGYICDDEDGEVNVKSIFSSLITYRTNSVYIFKVACSENHALLVIK